MFLIPASWYAVRAAKNKGRGVYARRDIPAGTVIGDYRGTIVRPEEENERRDGLYTMSIDDRYDVLAHPRTKGIHLINHSCAATCGIYPYRGHILYVAARKIFAGEEVTVNYMLGKTDGEGNDIPCTLHACHCGTMICTGSMHESERTYGDWEKMRKRGAPPRGSAMPAPYGAMLPPLAHYPVAVNLSAPGPYRFNAFGAEIKPPERYPEKTLPALEALRARIRTTGRQLRFPKLRLTVYGIRDGLLIVKR